MPEPRTLTCRCGAMCWRVSPKARGTHVICYCTDCQTAARALDASDRLDEAGGTAIFQTLPADITFLEGRDRLALMRLSPKGLFRWHAGCCGTPIANTLASPGFSFAGLVLPPGSPDFGKPAAHVQTKSARSPVGEKGAGAAGFALVRRAISARLSGRWRETPFFDANGRPMAEPRVLTLEERNAARP